MADLDHPPLRLLRFPDAIPHGQSLRDQALWADHVGAIWPDGEPTPLNDEQEVALTELRQLEKAKRFTPVFLNEKEVALATRELSRTAPRDALDPDGTSWSDSCGALLAGSSTDTPLRLPSVDETLRYLHYGKLPDHVTDTLVAEGLLERVDWLEEPLGFRARSSTLVPYLMTRAAEQVARRTGENWTLAPSGPEAIRWLAQPAPKGKTETSIALGLPALPALRDDVTMQQILELRADNGFAQARAEYVAHIAELTEAKRRQLQLRLNDPHSDRVLDDIALSLDEEMRRATTSWWRRLKRQDYWAIGVGVGTMAVTALGSASTPSLTVASTALAGLSAATPFVTRRGTPSFLRLTRTILAPA